MGALRGLGEARGAPPPLRGAQRDIGRDRCVVVMVVMVVMVVRVGVGMVKVGMGVVVVGGVRGWLGGGVLIVMHARSCKTIGPRIRTKLEPRLGTWNK